MIRRLRELRRQEEDADRKQRTMEIPGSETPQDFPSLATRKPEEIFTAPDGEEAPEIDARAGTTGMVPVRFRSLGDFDSLQIVPPHPDHQFWAPGSSEAGAHTLTYHGGPTCKVPKLFIIYAGFQGDRAQMEKFCKDIMESGYLSSLARYGSGNGQYLGSYDFRGAVPGTVDDAQYIKPLVRWVFSQPNIPQPDMQTMYGVLFGPNTVVQLNGQQSCSAFCGYHSGFGQALYLALPDTSCSGCHGPNAPTDALGAVISHEVAETASNPWGSGWYEDSTGMENGDICAWPSPLPRFGPWAVQGYYTNEQGCTMGAYQPVQPPQPPPPGPPPPGPGTDLTPRVEALEARIGQLNAWLKGVPNA